MQLRKTKIKNHARQQKDCNLNFNFNQAKLVPLYTPIKFKN